MSKLKRFELKGECYFITTTTKDRKPIFRKVHNIKVIINSLKFYKVKFRFKLCGYVLMPDHLHLLIIPEGCYTVSKIMHDFKSFASQELNRINKTTGANWQSSFYDYVIRDSEDFVEKLNYMHNNPLKAGLVEDPQSYLYSSCRNYFLEDNSLIEVDFIMI